MATLARIVTGRRSKWLVVLVWIALVIPLGGLGQQLSDVTDNRTESFLPPGAESTKALRVQEQRFPGAAHPRGEPLGSRPIGSGDAPTAARRRGDRWIQAQAMLFAWR